LARCKGLTEEGLVGMARALGPTIKLLDFQGLKPVGNEPLGRYAIIVPQRTRQIISLRINMGLRCCASVRKISLTYVNGVFGHRETASHMHACTGVFGHREDEPLLTCSRVPVCLGTEKTNRFSHARVYRCVWAPRRRTAAH
jgi:hypothetical protein